MGFNPFSSGGGGGGGSSGSLTAPVTITGVVGSSALTVNGATQTTSKPVFVATQTWNNVATTFTGISLNVTDTASASASLLMDLQVGGSSRANINKNGAITISPQSGTTFGVSFALIGVDSSRYIRTLSSNTIEISGTFSTIAGSGTSTIGSVTIGTSLESLGDVILGRAAAANLRLGAADAAAPVAQTLGVQSVVAGTSNTAGAVWKFYDSGSTGSAGSGGFEWWVTPAGGAGSSQNARAIAMALDSTKTLTLAGSLAINPTNGSVTFGQTFAITMSTQNGFTIRHGNNDGFALRPYSSGVGLLQFFNSSNVLQAALTTDAANTLALRNSTSAQAFRVYNTYTDASNYERLAVTYESNIGFIKSTAAGTGTIRSIRLYAGAENNSNGGYIDVQSSGTITFALSGTGTRWSINSSGHFLAGTDNTYDIGASGANRPRNIYAAGTLSFGTHSAIGAETVTGYITITDAGGTTRKLAVVS